MKKLVFALIAASFVFIGGIATASAHCGGCAEKSHKKVCTKCIESEKPCKCAKKGKKPCSKMIGDHKGEKPHRMHKDGMHKWQAKKQGDIFFNE